LLLCFFSSHGNEQTKGKRFQCNSFFEKEKRKGKENYSNIYSQRIQVSSEYCSRTFSIRSDTSRLSQMYWIIRLSCRLIWMCLVSAVLIHAPPLVIVDRQQSSTDLTLFQSQTTTRISNISTDDIILTTHRTDHRRFDVNSYRSSWKFVDKQTIRVRFHFEHSFLHSMQSVRFIVRHIQTGHTLTYDNAHERFNSTLTLYVQNIKYGRHTVCLLIYTLKSMITPRHVFCQDIINNFHKYGHHDVNADEHRNTFLFLLTQYAIVCGMLCLLQLIHAGRKRRFIRILYEKAHGLRQTMMDYHHRSQETKSTIDFNSRTRGIEYLIYNFDRNALNNDLLTSDEHIDVRRTYSKLSRPSMEIPMLLIDRHQSISNNDEQLSQFDTIDEQSLPVRTRDEPSMSLKSVSHILDDSKPWLTRLTDDGNTEQALVASECLQSSPAHKSRIHYL
jgi:hypothetical protein